MLCTRWSDCVPATKRKLGSGSVLITNDFKFPIRTLNCPMLRETMLMVEENFKLSKVMFVAASGPQDFTELETRIRKKSHCIQYWKPDSPMLSSVAISWRVRWSEQRIINY